MLRHGVQEHVRSDNGAEMRADRVRKWLASLGGRRCPSIPALHGKRLLRIVRRSLGYRASASIDRSSPHEPSGQFSAEVGQGPQPPALCLLIPLFTLYRAGTKIPGWSLAIPEFAARIPVHVASFAGSALLASQ